MAFYSELVGPALDARRKALAKLLAKAGTELGLGADGLVVRPLRPEDIGGANPEWMWSAAVNAWTSQGSTTIADNRYVSIYGIAYGDPDYYRGVAGTAGNVAGQLITQIKITREGSIVRIWNIEALKVQDDRTMYVDDPFTIDQNTTLKIELYNPSSAVTEERLMFLGDVVEKRGLLINP